MPPTWIETPIWQHFSDVAAARPNVTALDDGTVRLTYAELRDNALALASRLNEIGMPDEIVAIRLPTDASFAVSILACLAAGRRPPGRSWVASCGRR